MLDWDDAPATTTAAAAPEPIVAAPRTTARALFGAPVGEPPAVPRIPEPSEFRLTPTQAKVESGAILGAQCGVPTGKVIRGPGVLFWGTPARPIRQYLKELAALARLVKR